MTDGMSRPPIDGSIPASSVLLAEGHWKFVKSGKGKSGIWTGLPKIEVSMSVSKGLIVGSSSKMSSQAIERGLGQRAVELKSASLILDLPLKSSKQKQLWQV